MIRVMVVDDSAFVRQTLKAIVEQQPDMEVVATASDGWFALQKLDLVKPDVITLDVEMPRMDGLAFLDEMMRVRPTPVVVVSVHTYRGGQITLEALYRGAVDFVTKPRCRESVEFEALAADLIRKIRSAAQARVILPRRRAKLRELGAPESQLDRCVVAIGASTGGPAAVAELLQALPSRFPPTLVVQHMPKGFTKAFAERLSEIARLDVQVAQDGHRLQAGHVLVAPGGYHLVLEGTPGNWHVNLEAGPQVHYQRPSVDVLFESIARCAGPWAIGVLLTGMGRDGAAGLLAIRRAGGRTIAQDEETSVVYGMPQAAVALGAAEFVVGLDKIPALLRTLVVKKLKEGAEKEVGMHN